MIDVREARAVIVPFLIGATAIFFGMLSALTLARGQGMPTTLEVLACKSDAVRICRATIHSVPVDVLNCLIANKRRLHLACRAVLTARGY